MTGRIAAWIVLGGICIAARAAVGAPVIVTYPPGGLIQQIGLSTDTACLGEQVAAAAIATHPTDPAIPVEISIDGWPGNLRALQYRVPRAGRAIRFFARAADGLEEVKEVALDVLDCPGKEKFLRILSQRSPFHRYRVDFHAKPSRRMRGRSWQWNFGDGQTAVTLEPFVSHDYASSIAHPQPYTHFIVQVTETKSQLSAVQTIAIASSFDLSRSMGFVQAEVAFGVTIGSDGGADVSFVVTNHHDASITLERYLKEYLDCDPAKPPRWQSVPAQDVFGPAAPIVMPAGGGPGDVTIPAGAAQPGRFMLPGGTIPIDVCAIGYTFVGQVQRGGAALPVYGSLYFRVRRNPLFTQPVTDKKTLKALAHVVKKQLVPDPDRITGEQLYLLAQRGRVVRTADGWKKLK